MSCIPPQSFENINDYKMYVNFSYILLVLSVFDISIAKVAQNIFTKNLDADRVEKNGRLIGFTYRTIQLDFIQLCALLCIQDSR